MKIGFIDCAQFNILSAFQRPLGGSESAVTFLAIELARLGHDVSVYSYCDRFVEFMGVRNFPVTLKDNQLDFPQGFLEIDFDFLIVKNNMPQIGVLFHEHFNKTPRLIFWTGHASNQPALEPLSRSENIDAYDCIVAVSEWHQAELAKAFPIRKKQITIQRNAISPYFENLYLDDDEFRRSRPDIPRLAYTSTPFRGLDVLLELYPDIHRKVPTSELLIYSSLQPYGVAQASDQYAGLYALAQKTTGVFYKGSVSQPQLAARLRNYSILAYPNTFAETSCIAVMEAMAAGLFVISSDLGALPETMLGYGSNIPINHLRDKSIDSFTGKLTSAMQLQLKDPDAFYEPLYRQVEEMNENHTWAHRAREWVGMFESLINED